jgi:hypothetical protein
MLSIFSIYTNAYSLTSFKYTVKLIESNRALAPKEIRKLAKILNELHGTKKVGQVLGKMKLPNEVLEDTFMRLAIYTKKIKRKEAEEMMQYLKNVSGFRTTLRKIIGKNAKKTMGHLHELRLATKASKNGFKVVGIDKKFSDGIKSMPSDIDVLLKKNNKLFVIEAKNYLPMTNMKSSMIKGDMKTLSVYTKQNKSENIIPIFSVTNKPYNKNTVKILEIEAKKNGVQLIYGNPYEQIEKIKLLSEIL